MNSSLSALAGSQPTPQLFDDVGGREIDAWQILTQKACQLNRELGNADDQSNAVLLLLGAAGFLAGNTIGGRAELDQVMPALIDQFMVGVRARVGDAADTPIMLALPSGACAVQMDPRPTAEPYAREHMVAAIADQMRDLLDLAYTAGLKGSTRARALAAFQSAPLDIGEPRPGAQRAAHGGDQ